MRTRIQKWGNSLAVRIPRSVALDCRLVEGSHVELALEGGEIRLRPVQRSYDIEALVRGVTKTNLHGEIDAGERRGNETW